MGIKTEPKILFGPGTFRSESGQMVTKTADDVAVMHEHFTLLAERGIYPGVTKGHVGGSSAPKYGELRETWVDPAGNRIVGPLDDVNPELARAIEAGEFDKVSIEFSDHWWDADDKIFRDNVITGVAVLGAKWGAHKQPDKLTIARSQMSEAGGDDVNVYRLSMADIEGAPDEGGGEDVEKIEELKTRIAELEKANADLLAAQPDEEKVTLEAEVADLKAKLELASTAKTAADEKIAKAELDAKEAVVDSVLEAAVTADAEGNVRMKPDEAEVQKPVLMSMDDSQTIKLSEGEDGEPVMASPFEQAVAAIKAREPVLKLSEQTITKDTDPMHKAKPTEKKSALSEMDIEVAKKCGLDPDEVERVNAEGYDPHADVAAAQAERDK